MTIGAWTVDCGGMGTFVTTTWLQYCNGYGTQVLIYSLCVWMEGQTRLHGCNGLIYLPNHRVIVRLSLCDPINIVQVQTLLRTLTPAL